MLSARACLDKSCEWNKTVSTDPAIQLNKTQMNADICVLSDYVLLERSVYAVYLRNRHLSGKVRAFIDYLLGWFGPVPYWDRVVTSAAS
jgi:hypothetical protein